MTRETQRIDLNRGSRARHSNLLRPTTDLFRRRFSEQSLLIGVTIQLLVFSYTLCRNFVSRSRVGFSVLTECLSDLKQNFDDTRLLSDPQFALEFFENVKRREKIDGHSDKAACHEVGGQLQLEMMVSSMCFYHSIALSKEE